VDEYIAEHHITRAEFQREMAGLDWDPKNAAAFVDPKKVCLVLGFCDCVVPFKTGRALRADMAKPETVVLLSGHYTSYLYLPYIRHVARGFLGRRFREAQ